MDVAIYLRLGTIVVLVIFTTFNRVNWGMPVSGMSKENKKFQVKYQKCTYSKGHYVHVSGNI